jgi:lipopolysaccharide biosynthesis glycosyltransferase
MSDDKTADDKTADDKTADDKTADDKTADDKTADEKTLKMSSSPLHSNAYTWLFMKGDSYLPGIFASVYSIRRTNPAADLVVMVTDDVSQHSRDVLLKVATHIFDIPYISVQTKKMKTTRQQQLYETWLATSYTKWNALALPYKKIILIDGDTIHTTNTDELFELQAPALPYASPFMKPLGTIQNYYKGPTGPEGYPIHGSKISIDVIMTILNKGGLLPTATAVLLEPSMTDYNSYKSMIKSMEPFGFPECHSMFDEQSLAYFYAHEKKKDITAVHQRYNYYPWKNGFMFPGEIPKIIHFFSDTKPWMVDYNKYDDIITWYKIAAAGISFAGITAEDIKLKTSNTSAAEKAEDKFINKFVKVNSVLDIYDLF